MGAGDVSARESGQVHRMKKALLVAGAFVAGWVAGRVEPIDRLDHWNWVRITWGPGDGGQPLGWFDMAVFMTLHPWRFLRAYERSPFYQAPEPPKVVDINDIFGPA